MIYLKLFYTFFKIGAFTFGGGYAMLPLIQDEVLSNGWLALDDLINFVAVSESTPGPFAINMATYVGSETGGILGAACATLGVVLPSFIVILIVARCYLAFKNSRVVKGCMSGLKPVAVGLIGAAAVSMALSVLFPAGLTFSVLSAVPFWCSLSLAVGGSIMAFKKVHPIIIIVISAAVGIALGYLGFWE